MRCSCGICVIKLLVAIVIAVMVSLMFIVLGDYYHGDDNILTVTCFNFLVLKGKTLKLPA